MKRLLSRVLFVLGLTLLAGEARAQSVPININAAVVRSCAAVTTPVNLAVSYDPNATAPATANGGVAVTCTRGTQYQYQFNDGTHASAASRRLASPGATPQFLNYDVTATTVANGAVAVPLGMTVPVVGDRATGRTIPMTLGVGVSLPVNQDVSTDVGAFTDTMQVTISVVP